MTVTRGPHWNDIPWLQRVIDQALEKGWCTNSFCTTCDAREFRNTVLKAAGRVADRPVDRAMLQTMAEVLQFRGPLRSTIARGLSSVEAAPAREQPVRSILTYLWSFAWASEISAILQGSWAGSILEEMRAHEAGTERARVIRERENSPEAVEARKAEKRRVRAEAHAIRMAEQAEHNRRWYAARQAEGSPDGTETNIQP